MSRKILVVEDNQINQKVICWQLDRLGFSCDVVSTGAASLKAIEIRNYGLIFMDMYLPGLDGCETTELIRLAGFTMPIIALTAEDSGESFQKCLDAGMNGYLSKPAVTAVLQNVLEVWLPTEMVPSTSGSVPIEILHCAR
jgi:CheY-like chemotaxis protein